MSKVVDFSLYLVSHRYSLSDKDFFKLISQAVTGGVSLVQLREKNIAQKELIALGKQLLDILNQWNIPLIINDDVYAAKAIGAAGVHLGQSDGSVSEARALLGSDAIIGLSVETMEQALQAQKESITYLAASPVFPSRTKIDCKAAWGLEKLKQLTQTSTHPVIAIGGIQESNLDQVLECKVAGVAVVSAIFEAPCPRQAAINMRKTVAQHAKK
jgi:thiamine-phosphate pyrophosphorylase